MSTALTMNQYKLSFPKTIKASVQLPSSKSISNRALIINALANRSVTPDNLSNCDDTAVMISALNSSNEIVDIKAAGTAMRFLTAYLSVTPGTRIITGSTRMRQRPIRVLVDALSTLGAQIEYTEQEGYPPLRITGKTLTGGEISLKGDISSQYISALLMIAPTLKDGLRISLVGEVISRPYINLTIQLMSDFGVKAIWETPNSLVIAPQSYRSTSYCVESDWSAASYWYQMAALADEAEIELKGLFAQSYQGDSKGAALFDVLGVETTYTAQGVCIKKKTPKVQKLEANLVDMPDLAQTFVATCALLNIPFHFTGLQTLKIKETDRIAALITEMGKLGYRISEANDAELFWNGERMEAQESPVIRTYEDHRMAMALAPAAMLFPAIRIAEPHVVSKSYPDFWSDLERAGVHIQNEEVASTHT